MTVATVAAKAVKARRAPKRAPAGPKVTPPPPSAPPPTASSSSQGSDGADGGEAQTPPPATPARQDPRVVSTGSNLVLGVLLYAWVVMPLLTGGPSRVKDVWRAKFMNKDAKGGKLS